MTVIARPTASLLTGANCTTTQSSIFPSVTGVSSSFIQTLENMVSAPVSQTDSQGQIQSTHSILEIGVLQLQGASLTPSNQIHDSENENPFGSVLDPVWLANWFQNNAPAPALQQAPVAETETVRENSFSSSLVPAQTKAPATASLPFPLPVMASGWVEPALMEAPSMPLAMFSSKLSSRIGVPITELQKQSPQAPPNKPVNAPSNASTALSSNAAGSWSVPSTSAFQATYQAAPIGLIILEKQFPKNLSTDSDKLRPREVSPKAPIDSSGAANLGHSAGFKDFKEVGNDLWVPVMPGSAPVSLNPNSGQKLTDQTVGAEAVPQSHSLDAQWTSNWADPVNQWVERSSPSTVPAQSIAPATVFSPFPLPVMFPGRLEPALMEAPPKPLAVFYSEFSSRIDVPISENQKQIPWVFPDKSVNALANAPLASRSSAAASLSLPSTSEFQATSQAASIGLLIVEKKSPKNCATDSDNFRSREVFFKSPIDSSEAVRSGQSVGVKDFKDFGNDLWMPVFSESAQVSLDLNIGQNFTNQTMGTEAVPPSHSPDAQWTSNLTDTVSQWVERSLQMAELTVPNSGQDSLEVRIVLNGQEATVYFLTEHAQYREAIESHIENLSERLADQGLKLAGSFVGQGSAQNSPHKPSAYSLPSQRHESEPALANVLAIDPVLREMKSVHHGQVLDVFA
ncbi:flagellar hook-length control protein FliK [Limnohabitans sp. DM1]|uniref:flagellar hook-length control protein FliK n=1 Tax=Limnohabitans sp. DM1 TaxID=1597955 RepID=UPI000A7D81A3|nr:flagellar hook-length control protein FliK [Limnohabitans sp. DM1]